MAIEEPQNTWDKIKEEALNEQMDDSSNMEMSEALGDEHGFHERIGEAQSAEDEAMAPQYEEGDAAFLDRDSE